MYSKYFDESEFACHCCGELPENGMNPILIEKLDELRENIGFPIHVNSGYRCEVNNAANGGVSNSQHLLGNAADIVCDDISYGDFIYYVQQIGFDGIGIYADQGFIHVDCRSNGDEPNTYLWEG